MPLLVQSCISFDSYIKPQLSESLEVFWGVVYLLIPTSNHNFNAKGKFSSALYIFWFLHQTTTVRIFIFQFPPLYIFWFLHQTTTVSLSECFYLCCISFDSYIKPQLMTWTLSARQVVYLLIPTSNHNLMAVWISVCEVVYLLIPTSNHNPEGADVSVSQVVYLLIPTSNHNLDLRYRSYINCCISFDSYIKPQLYSCWNPIKFVVYLLIPTSNHNYRT